MEKYPGIGKRIAEAKEEREETIYTLAAYERARCLVDAIISDGCAKAMPAGIYSDELEAACCNGDCTKN